MYINTSFMSCCTVVALCTYIKLQTGLRNAYLRPVVKTERCELLQFRKSVFLCNRLRYFRAVCYSSTHDHHSPEKPVPLGSWIYHGIQRTVHMETAGNWTFVIG